MKLFPEVRRKISGQRAPSDLREHENMVLQFGQAMEQFSLHFFQTGSGYSSKGQMATS